jgi:dihydroneopterin aldolase
VILVFRKRKSLAGREVSVRWFAALERQIPLFFYLRNILGASSMPILTSKAYSKALEECGESHSIIRVRNLSTQALVGGDPWGIPTDTMYRRNKLQPIFLSAALSLRMPFNSAASADRLNESTVNYSTLSKEILKVVASRRPDLPHPEGFVGIQRDWALSEFLCWIYVYLTGRWPYGPPPIASVARDFLDGGCPCLEDEHNIAYKPPLLDVSRLIEMELSVLLPKATLMSSGVSLTTALGYYPGVEERGSPLRSVLKLHDLRIPTLIGVNINERAAKQIVVVNVELDPYLHRAQDFYNELEQIVFKVRSVQLRLSCRS